MTPYIVAYALPVLVLILAIPLLAGIVPPNRWYGFRTPKTRSSREVWYRANRAAALYMIAAVGVAIAVNAALMTVRSDWPEARLVMWMAGSVTIAVVIAAVCSLVHLRRL